MLIRDRVRELRRVPASQLRPNPRNWRTHPARQRDALRGVLAEIGYADALLARELPDGSLELIDGHLRAESTPDALVPVLVVDVDEHEAGKLLAVLDPLAGMAETDGERLRELLADFDTQHEALESLVRELAQRAKPLDLSANGDPEPPAEARLPATSHQLVVECRDEADQESLYERLNEEGYRCRVLTL
ncbi:MAG: hypothetical protein K1X74_00625 [Pirellulales bacterium]|nr:hypothetical protein [Pirellulales bacterium]